MSSWKPASRACLVPGTQIVPAEVAVVPPTCADLLAKQNIEALQRANQRCRHAGGARAGDEDVDLGVHRIRQRA